MTRTAWAFVLVLLIVPVVASGTITLSDDTGTWKIEKTGCDFNFFVRFLVPRLVPYTILHESWQVETAFGEVGKLFEITFSECTPETSKEIRTRTHSDDRAGITGVSYFFSMRQSVIPVQVQSGTPERPRIKFLPVEIIFEPYRIRRATLKCLFEGGMTWSGQGRIRLSPQYPWNEPTKRIVEDVESIYVIVDVYPFEPDTNAKILEQCEN